MPIVRTSADFSSAIRWELAKGPCPESVAMFSGLNYKASTLREMDFPEDLGRAPISCWCFACFSSGRYRTIRHDSKRGAGTVAGTAP